MIQAIVSNTVLLPTLTTPMHYNVVTYTDSYSSMVSSLSAGYFIWDLTMCMRHFKLYGIEFTGHAVGSVYVMLLSLRPFCQPWIGRFLIYEASTPFVNINWFIMQCNAKSKNCIPLWFNVVNGLLLMTVFFVVRICWGTIASALLFKQMWNVRDELPKVSAVAMMSLNIFMNWLNVLWFKKMLKIAKKLAKPAPAKLD
ncbi:TDA4-like protein [Saccharomyces kudriavzevii IFO 1802]|nr:TDA4-like protein [Saccharomyces kudriavzevii IFO 1802]